MSPPDGVCYTDSVTPEDLTTVAQIGRALWMNPARAEPITAEALSAVALLELTGERATERAARALLDRAVKEGMAANALVNLASTEKGSAAAAFFRLYPEERFLLAAMHLANWPYARVARVLGDTVEGVQAKAWAARVALAAENHGASRQVPYPAGSGARGPNCPEYDPKAPWTQRFLDEEVHSGRERLFLQNHLMACGSCLSALSRSRDVYYAVEGMLPRLAADGAEFVRTLTRIHRQGTLLVNPAARTLGECLRDFAARPDVRWPLLAAAGLLGYWVLQRIFGS
ncbi:MAG: hypothetical protein NDJ89_15650 [Oligoflexia bacterium]|nr:hypothetical protein [Oligoflexia bacterium]